jgi:hypothetical protein
VIIPRRYRGPDESGNGGYSCGVFAQLVDGDAEVTLRTPPPLDTELRVDGLDVFDGQTLVAEVRPTVVGLELPPPPAHVEAGDPDPHHPFPNCFVCGPARDDGLRLTPRGYGSVVAAPCRLPEVRPELVWAALDCPGAFAVADFSRGASVLGRLSVHIDALPDPGDDLVVVGWDLGGGDGRRSHAGTALYRVNQPLAWGRATWFALPSRG